MSSIGTGYDLSAHQFSPDGRVFQVEYAEKAVGNSGTAVGVKCKDGVVFGVEKLVTSKLYEAGTGKRIFSIDKHIGMAVAGLLSDARQHLMPLDAGYAKVKLLFTRDAKVVAVAREDALTYRSVYGEPIPLKYLADKVSGYIHAYTLYSAYRPFGCSVFIGSYDKVDGADLHMIEPSGVSYGYYGCAAGKGQQAAKTEIEKLKLENMTCKEAVKEVAKIIYVVHDEVKDKAFELELSWVGEESNGIHQIVPKQIAQEAEEQAKKSMEEDSDSDDDL